MEGDRVPQKSEEAGEEKLNNGMKKRNEAWHCEVMPRSF